MSEKLEPQKIGPFHLTVKKHRTDKSADKEPVYIVSLKSPSRSETPIQITIKSKSKEIFDQYPLNQELSVTFTIPQTQF